MPLSRKSLARGGFALMLLAGLAGGSALAPALAQVADAPDPAAAAQPPAGSVGGMGDINLFPKRVVIDGRRAIATVGLYNKAASEGDYEIDIVDMMMTGDGQLVPLDSVPPGTDTSRVKTASPIIRYSPRRVLLRANKSQTIRIMARADATVPDGEYRSHFMAIAIPPTTEGGLSIENAVNGGQDNGIGVTITPRFGISIPVIVRIGQTTLQAGLADFKVLTARDGTQAIQLAVTRSGTRSAFGDIEITAPGLKDPVAIARGVGVYPEVDQRTIVIPVDPAVAAQALKPGTRLKVTYTDDDFEPGARLAEQTFTVP